MFFFFLLRKIYGVARECTVSIAVSCVSQNVLALVVGKRLRRSICGKLVSLSMAITYTILVYIDRCRQALVESACLPSYRRNNR